MVGGMAVLMTVHDVQRRNITIPPTIRVSIRQFFGTFIFFLLCE